MQRPFTVRYHSTAMFSACPCTYDQSTNDIKYGYLDKQEQQQTPVLMSAVDLDT
jgi:hypothetical protein